MPKKTMPQMTHTWLHGISGKMGLALKEEISKSSTFLLSGGSDYSTSLQDFETGLGQCNHIIDFSSPEGHLVLQNLVKKNQIVDKSILIGTTGLSVEQKKFWSEFASKCNLRVLIAPNTSLGIMMLVKSSVKVAQLCFNAKFDIEIEETHHRAKKDSPSGTALFIAESLQQHLPFMTLKNHRSGSRGANEIGLSVTRGGGVFGEHTVRFLGDFEEFSLSHRAYSRELFSRGALVLSQWLLQQKSGSYTLHDIDLEEIGKISTSVL